MKPTLTIRPLSNADSARAATLILSIQQGEFNVPITLADQPDLLDLETAYFNPGGHFWGAFADGELVGTIALLAPSNIGVIRKMFVKPAFRGKQWGVAQQLFETLIAYAREKKMVALYLGTIHFLHAACRFYEKNGFKKIPQPDLPKAFPLMPVDDTFYQLPLL